MGAPNLAQRIAALPDRKSAAELLQMFAGVYDRLASSCLTSAGLVIKTASSPLAKTGASITYLMVNGKLRQIAASTDMAALAGTVTNAKFNVFCFFIDEAGNLTSAMGVEGANRESVKFPEIPAKKALIGFVIINPTGTGNFVGGTTALDDATVAPNAIYVNTVGPVDPAAVIP